LYSVIELTMKLSPPALPARLQADDVDRVGVIFELAARLVVAHVRVANVEPEVLYVPEQMPLCVLRARRAEVRADSEIGNRLLRAAVAIDRQPAQHHEAAPLEQLAEHIRKHRAKRRKRKILRRKLRQILAACLVRADRRIELAEFCRRKRANPFRGTPREVRSAPDRRAGDRPGRHARLHHRARIPRRTMRPHLPRWG
jgi:hypothetical protein